MIKIFSLLLSLMASLEGNYKQELCRITYYHPYQDKWGNRVACPSTSRAIQGVTVAAHPDFPFGTKIYIPELRGVIGNGVFIVQDRGSAITKKRASQGKSYVFDVYVENKDTYYKSIKNKHYMNVIVNAY